MSYSMRLKKAFFSTGNGVVPHCMWIHEHVQTELSWLKMPSD